MDNLEAQMQRIQQFFEGIAVDGIAREARIIEPSSEEGCIEIELISASDINVASVHLSVPLAQSALILEDAERAVLAEMLKATALMSSEIGHSLISMLYGDRSGDSVISTFNLYMDNYLTQNQEGQAHKITLSEETMDKLCAAWITWRAKNHQPPMTAAEALGDLDDHPF